MAINTFDNGTHGIKWFVQNPDGGRVVYRNRVQRAFDKAAPHSNATP